MRLYWCHGASAALALMSTLLSTGVLAAETSTSTAITTIVPTPWVGQPTVRANPSNDATSLISSIVSAALSATTTGALGTSSPQTNSNGSAAAASATTRINWSPMSTVITIIFAGTVFLAFIVCCMFPAYTEHWRRRVRGDEDDLEQNYLPSYSEKLSGAPTTKRVLVSANRMSSSSGSPTSSKSPGVSSFTSLTSPTSPTAPALTPEQLAEQALLQKQREDAEARRYQVLHPPSRRSAATPEEVRDVRSLGKSLAWRFVVDSRGTVSSRDERGKSGSGWVQEIRFLRRREKTVYARLPMVADLALKGKKWCYYEITITEMCESPSTTISVGVITIPYPTFRLVGSYKHSIGYRSDTGNVHQDDPDNGRTYAALFKKGDTVGCGYDIGRGAIFMTLNGKLLNDAQVGCKLHDYHMAVSANNLCSLLINVGTEPFLFAPANPPNVGNVPVAGGDVKVGGDVGVVGRKSSSVQPCAPPSAIDVSAKAYEPKWDPDELTPSTTTDSEPESPERR